MLSVRDIMASDPVVVTHDTPASDALRAMLDRKINSIVVCRNGRVEGIFTPRDLLSRASDKWDGVPVSELMTRGPITVPVSAAFAEAAELMEEARVRHLPVTEDGRLVGVVSMRDLMHHRAEHLENVVRQQTSELETKNETLERRNREMRYHLDLAGRIQRQLLPDEDPMLEPFAVAASYHPLDHVSGDCYDIVELTPERFGLLIADACGHGIPAAFVSVMARTIFQAYGREAGSPAAVLRTMNDQLPCLIEADRFITMCYATVDRPTFRMTYATAGHPAPLWYRHNEDRVESLQGKGHMIGIVDDPAFANQTVQLRPSDAVLFYTDGLIEGQDAAGTQFGTERLAKTLRGCRDVSAAGVIESIERAFTGFVGARSFGDDVTFIALTVGGET